MEEIMNLLAAVTMLSQVYLGGENIGFNLKSQGPIISGTYDVIYNNKIYNPLNFDIRAGDVINKIDGFHIDSLDEMSEYIKRIKKSEVELELIRGEENITRTIKLINADGKLQTGLFIKPSTMGIGTVTFYSTSNYYVALGHPVREFDNILPLKDGTIFNSEVEGIKRAEEGKVGEKIATLNVDQPLGNVIENTEYGMSGYFNEIPKEAQLIDVASYDEIKTGPAKICTVLNGSKKEYFDINIVSKNNNDTNNGLKIEITDKRLLEKTGGIVAGMSGSPIIQDGKLVGAVTHVLVSSPTKGYGIVIQRMFEHLYRVEPHI